MLAPTTGLMPGSAANALRPKSSAKKRLRPVGALKASAPPGVDNVPVIGVVVAPPPPPPPLPPPPPPPHAASRIAAANATTAQRMRERAKPSVHANALEANMVPPFSSV